MRAEICQRVLDGFGMPVEWVLSIVVPILLLSCDVSCAWYEGSVVDVRNRLCRIVTVDEMQFGFMPERGTIDAVFI